MIGYSTITALADGTLGVVSSPTIVRLYITVWLLTWFGMDAILIDRDDARFASATGAGHEPVLRA